MTSEEQPADQQTNSIVAPKKISQHFPKNRCQNGGKQNFVYRGGKTSNTLIKEHVQLGTFFVGTNTA